jgi:vancomycin resistance protein YoaR
MSKTLRIIIGILLVPVALAIMVGVLFAAGRMSNGGEVMGRIVIGGAEVDRMIVGGAELGGLGSSDALNQLQALQDRMMSTPVPVTIAGHEFSLDPSAVGFQIDRTAALETAMAQGRTGHLGTQFSWWVKHLGGQPVSFPIPFTISDQALLETLRDWEADGIDDPAFPGEVTISEGKVSARYPKIGTGIDIEAARGLLMTALGDPNRVPVELPTADLAPTLTNADIDAAVAEAEGMLNGPVTLASAPTGGEVVIPESVLGQSLSVTRDDSTTTPVFRFTWRLAPLQAFIEPLWDSLSTPTVDARLDIDVTTDIVTVVPGIQAQEPDLDRLTQQVDVAARSQAKAASLLYMEGAEPEVTTADIQALGVKGKISEFTTQHKCCENRVTNIHLIADATNGAIVMPGETWSLNAYVGQRTSAKGYLPAPAIIMGELHCCDDPINIGGGTSQFTTTLYNAIFFAGLEDVEHTPHSIYITRYPEGREATLGWMEPDLVFRNNTNAAVVIRAYYTDTTLTVKFYGDNGGIKVEAGKSDRYNFSGINKRYIEDPTLPCGTEKVKQQGSGGWSVDVYRYITFPDGRKTTETWRWHYSGASLIIERNSATCPTVPPETTTTVPPGP